MRCHESTKFMTHRAHAPPPQAQLPLPSHFALGNTPARNTETRPLGDSTWRRCRACSSLAWYRPNSTYCGDNSPASLLNGCFVIRVPLPSFLGEKKKIDSTRGLNAGGSHSHSHLEFKALRGLEPLSESHTTRLALYVLCSP